MSPFLEYVPYPELLRVRRKVSDPLARAGLFADLCRLNTLYMVSQAGSGHLGTSFSSLDILSWLYLETLKLPSSLKSFKEKRHDIFFSSKGHDAPGLYAVMIGMGLLPERELHRLRRLGGLPGHPDVTTPFIEANTGSLGMGLSKAKGMVLAARLQKKRRQVFVLTGDGEWQEGQGWEALQITANLGLHEITVIVDRNRIQSDIWTERVSPLGDLEKKFKAFGWRVFRVNGHDPRAFSKVLKAASADRHKPKIILADTVKGKGVSFMESTRLGPKDRLYLFHSGAPSYEDTVRACQELKSRIASAARRLGLGDIRYGKRPLIPRPVAVSPVKLVDAYSEALVRMGKKVKRLVALDADLAKDCGLLAFEKAFPERMIECGIAEQDMVSTAGGLALQGMLPVVHSFACFLSTRPNEQFYTNATEGKRVIYVASLAGLLPAAPGHSHQSVRDISALGAVPGLVMIQPSSPRQLRQALEWAVFRNPQSTYLRLHTPPCELAFDPLKKNTFKTGRGEMLASGRDAVLIAYGPRMLSEAMRARELLLKQRIRLAVIDLCWLNTVDRSWLRSAVRGYPNIFTLDDHFLKGGQGEMIAQQVNALGLRVVVTRFGVEGIPRCGAPAEVLEAHGLDAVSLARKITHVLRSR